jgi:hypothetical protein
MTSYIEKLEKIVIRLSKEVDDERDHVADLELILNKVSRDLLMRAEVGSDGCKVVDLSSSIWIKLKELLKETKS